MRKSKSELKNIEPVIPLSRFFCACGSSCLVDLIILGANKCDTFALGKRYHALVEINRVRCLLLIAIFSIALFIVEDS